MFTSSKKRGRREFHVVVVQKEMYKSVLHMQNWFFAYSYCFLDVAIVNVWRNFSENTSYDSHTKKLFFKRKWNHQQRRCWTVIFSSLIIINHCHVRVTSVFADWSMRLFNKHISGQKITINWSIKLSINLTC